MTETLRGTGVRILLTSEVPSFAQPEPIGGTLGDRAERQAEERGELVTVVAGAFADLVDDGREYRLWGNFMGPRAVPLNEDPTSALISIAEEHRDDLRWNLQHDLRYGGHMDLSRWEFYAFPFTVELSPGLRERLSPAWAERPPGQLPGER